MTQSRHTEQRGPETCVESCRISKCSDLPRDIGCVGRDADCIREGDSGDSVRNEMDVDNIGKRKFFHYSVSCHLRDEKDS